MLTNSYDEKTLTKSCNKKTLMKKITVNINESYDEKIRIKLPVNIFNEKLRQRHTTKK